MGLLTRTIEGVIDMFTKKELDPVSTTEQTPTPTPKPEEEWVWVEGYKGTDRNMQCRGHQFELGVQYDIPDDQEIEECKTGFHLCLKLGDVYDYYDVGDGNRFFKVQALVRKTDKDKYCSSTTWYNGYRIDSRHNKLAARSIILKSELTIDEILRNTDAENLTEDYKRFAIELGVQRAVALFEKHTLMNDGYSDVFATYIVKHDLYERAHAYGSQKDLSMDVKVLGILYDTIGGSK